MRKGDERVAVAMEDQHWPLKRAESVHIVKRIPHQERGHQKTRREGADRRERGLEHQGRDLSSVRQSKRSATAELTPIHHDLTCIDPCTGYEGIVRREHRFGDRGL